MAGEMTIIIRCVNKRMYVADYATQRAPGEVTSIDSELYMDDEEEEDEVVRRCGDSIKSILINKVLISKLFRCLN